MHQDHVARVVQLDHEYPVAAKGLPYGARGTINEPPLFVEVPGQSDLDTWSGEDTQRGLRFRVTQIPSRQILFADARNCQGSPAYLGRPSVRGGQPRKTPSARLLQLQSPSHSCLKRYTVPVPVCEILLHRLSALSHVAYAGVLISSFAFLLFYYSIYLARRLLLPDTVEEQKLRLIGRAIHGI